MKNYLCPSLLSFIIALLISGGANADQFKTCGVDSAFQSNLKKVSTDLQNTGKYYQCIQDNPTNPDGPEILCVYKMMNKVGDPVYIGLLDLRNYASPHFSDAGTFDDNGVIFNSSEDNSSFSLTSETLSLISNGYKTIVIDASSVDGTIDSISASRARPNWVSPAWYSCVRVDPSLPKL